MKVIEWLWVWLCDVWDGLVYAIGGLIDALLAGVVLLAIALPFIVVMKIL